MSTSQAIEWWTFVDWKDEEGGLVANARSALDAPIRGDFKLEVWHEDAPYDSAPAAAWHWCVTFDGLLACHGFAHDNNETGRRACQRTAVKMAAFHGMALPIDVMRQVAGLLVDPFGVPDPQYPKDPTKNRPARRVAYHGHSPKILARAAEQKRREAEEAQLALLAPAVEDEQD